MGLLCAVRAAAGCVMAKACSNMFCVLRTFLAWAMYEARTWRQLLVFGCSCTTCCFLVFNQPYSAGGARGSHNVLGSAVSVSRCQQDETVARKIRTRARSASSCLVQDLGWRRNVLVFASASTGVPLGFSGTTIIVARTMSSHELDMLGECWVGTDAPCSCVVCLRGGPKLKLQLISRAV